MTKKYIQERVRDGDRKRATDPKTRDEKLDGETGKQQKREWELQTSNRDVETEAARPCPALPPLPFPRAQYVLVRVWDFYVLSPKLVIKKSLRAMEW